MRKTWLGFAAAAAVLALATPSFSMGSGGSGGATEPATSDYAIAVKLIKHEMYAQAIPHLLIALADNPDDADTLNYLGYTKRMTGDFPASLGYYKRALALKPDHKGAHEYLGELYLQMHDPASAQKELDTLASLCPDGCEERDTLTKAIAAYGAGAPAPKGW
ncbi:MAG: tetratricopeptide repeat protein [Rhizomicrobium sp.]